MAKEKLADVVSQKFQGIYKQEEEKAVRIAQTQEKDIQEGTAYLYLAIQNLEYLHSCQTIIPKNLRASLEKMTYELLIKVGQKIPKELLLKMNIPQKFLPLIMTKEKIKTFWES